MERKIYSITPNLVLRICGSMSQNVLREDDYFPDGTQDNKKLLRVIDKEFYWKSLIMAITHEGMVESQCCPIHSNEALESVMKVIKAQFPETGKGNIGFGSIFYAKDPGCVEEVNAIVAALKQAGVFAVAAERYDNVAFLDTLTKHHIIPLLTAEPLAKDGYIFLKNIHVNLEEQGIVDGYEVVPREGLRPIKLHLAELSAGQINMMPG